MRYYNADKSRYPLKPETIARREEIAKRIALFTFGSINVQAISKEFGVYYQTIENDIKRIIEHWPVQQRERVEIDIGSAITESLRVAKMKLYRAQEEGESKAEIDRIQLTAANTVSKIASDYAKYSERRGLLDVPADKIEHSVSDENAIMREFRAFLRGEGPE